MSRYYCVPIRHFLGECSNTLWKSGVVVEKFTVASSQFGGGKWKNGNGSQNRTLGNRQGCGIRVLCIGWRIGHPPSPIVPSRSRRGDQNQSCQGPGVSALS